MNAFIQYELSPSGQRVVKELLHRIVGRNEPAHALLEIFTIEEFSALGICSPEALPHIVDGSFTAYVATL